MPNRILRDWTDSEPINSLSVQAEVFFVRLIMKADDFGRFNASPKLLRSILFPIRDGVRDTDITRWLAECETAGLLRVYTSSDAKPLLEICKFGQRSRAEKSKFEGPPTIVSNSPPDDRTPLTIVSKCPSPVSIPPPYAETKFGDEVRRRSSEFDSCDEPRCDSPPEDSVLGFPTVKGKSGRVEWHLTEAKLAEYIEAFPGVDVLAEARKALQWCRDNPTKRKTSDGMPKFLGGWMTRVQNGPPRNGNTPQISQSDPRGNFAALEEHRRRKAELFGEDRDAITAT